MTFHNPHALQTGQAVALTVASHGLTQNVAMFFVVDTFWSGRLAATPQEAMARTLLLSLNSTAALSVKHLVDGLEGRYVVPSGLSITGSDGAWKAKSGKIYIEDFGAVADSAAGTDNWAMIMSALWCAQLIGKRKIYANGGKYASKWPIACKSFDFLTVAGRSRPANGVTLVSDSGSDGSELAAHTGWLGAAGSELVRFDGNQYGLKKLNANMIPMAAGGLGLEGWTLRGKGEFDVISLNGVYARGTTGLIARDVYIVDFSGEGWMWGSGAEAQPPASTANDDVDGNFQSSFYDVQIEGCGGNGMSSIRARTSTLNAWRFRSINNSGCGILGCYIQNNFFGPELSGNGKRSPITTGGARFIPSESGALCRDVAIFEPLREGNFNFDINTVSGSSSTPVTGIAVYGGGFNQQLSKDGGGAVTNKACFRIGTYTYGFTHSGGYMQDYDNSDGDIWYYDVAATAQNIKLEPKKLGHSTSQLRAVSPVKLVMNAREAVAYTFSGSTPVDTFINGKPLGINTLTPVLEGITTAGAGAGVTATGEWWYQGGDVKFWFEYTQTSHTGTGAARIVLFQLPENFHSNLPLSFYQDGATFSGPPQALTQGASKNILLRQQASATSSATNIAGPTGVFMIGVEGSYRRSN